MPSDPDEDRLVVGLWQRQQIAGLQFGRTFAIEAARRVAGDQGARSKAYLGHLGAVRRRASEGVQERLGHANVSITLDIYSHVSEGLQSAAADRVAGIIFSAPAEERARYG